MVAVDHSNEQTRIVLTPNRSMSWRGNQLFLLSMIVLSGLIGTGFALMGAWVILPFAGLEMAALGSALYYVSWKLSYQEVLTLSAQQLLLEKGVYRPRQSWRFERDQVSLSIETENHPWSSPGIKIRHRQQLIVLGEFLNRADCKKLLGELRALGVPTRTHGQAGRQSF